MATYSQVNVSTCHTVLTVEKLILTISCRQERVCEAKAQNTAVVV